MLKFFVKKYWYYGALAIMPGGLIAAAGIFILKKVNKK